MSEAILSAEADLLGACLVDPLAADAALDLVEPQDFLSPQHGLIFGVIAHHVRTRTPLDVSTVAVALAGHVTVTQLVDLTLRVTGGSYARHHARTILAASQLRRTASLLAEHAAVVAGMSPTTENASLAYNGLRSALDETFVRGGTQLPIRLSDAERGLLERLEARQQIPRGIPTGFRDLDTLLGGMRDTEMIVLAARPSIGKSLFAANIAEHVSMGSNPKPVLVFSFEMSAADLYRRYLFGAAEVSPKDAHEATLGPVALRRLREAHANLSVAPWWVCDAPGLTMQQVHARSRAFFNKHGKGLLILDYLQLMKGEGVGRYEKVTSLSNDAKALAKDLGVPVVVLSQLNRAGENRGETLHSLSELRESGSIEQDADVVLFLLRDRQKQGRHECLVQLEKNRAGETGTATVIFDPQGPKFVNKSLVEEFR